MHVIISASFPPLKMVMMVMTFFNQIDSNCLQLTQSINCAPMIRPLDEAHVQFDDIIASVRTDIYD